MLFIKLVIQSLLLLTYSPFTKVMKVKKPSKTWYYFSSVFQSLKSAIEAFAETADKKLSSAVSLFDRWLKWFA